MIRSRSSNFVVAIGLVSLASIGAAFPYYYLKKRKQDSKSLQDKEGALTGSQVIRGAYLNTGSRDVGIDPDWDPVTRTYKGRSSLHQQQKKGD